MKIKPGYMMREVAETHVVVPTGEATLDFSGMMTLNGTGAFLWKQLAEDKAEPQLVNALMDEYEVDEATAKSDISAFLDKLKAAGLFV